MLNTQKLHSPLFDLIFFFSLSLFVWYVLTDVQAAITGGDLFVLIQLLVGREKTISGSTRGRNLVHALMGRARILSAYSVTDPIGHFPKHCIFEDR